MHYFEDSLMETNLIATLFIFMFVKAEFYSLQKHCYMIYYKQKNLRMFLPRKVLNYICEVLCFHPDKSFNIPLEIKDVL
jgi:hypothetical protein